MCTAIYYQAKSCYFGRNLDLERRYSESITIAPRNYIFKYNKKENDKKHYAMIGTATVVDGFPLYYDATNEFGLSIAGLNFVGNAHFDQEKEGKINIAPYELIPYILGNCADVDQCIEELQKINLVDIPFNPSLQNAQLHWLIADKTKCITLEYMNDGIKIYDNPVGVLTNNPPFDHQMINLNNYLNITSEEAENRFSDKIDLAPYSRGMGGIGMPGDNSSMSRFVRVTFTKLNSVVPQTEIDSIGQMFHILSSVEQQEGSVKVGDGFERTQYSSCCDINKCIYYYRTYSNNQITAIDMNNEDIDASELISYKMIYTQQIRYMN